MAARGFVPTNQDLADILGRTIFHSEKLHFFDFLDSQVSRSLDFQIPGFTDSRLPAGMSRGQLAGEARAFSAVAPDHKVQDIQGTRAILREPHQYKPCLGNSMHSL